MRLFSNAQNEKNFKSPEDNSGEKTLECQQHLETNKPEVHKLESTKKQGDESGMEDNLGKKTLECQQHLEANKPEVHKLESTKKQGDESGMEENEGKDQDSLKSKWYRNTSFARLKVNEKDFKHLLFAHKEASSPQAIQGMWQAYGQMRAARTTGRAAVFTGFMAGIASAMLWLYQRTLSAQLDGMKKREKSIQEREESLDSILFTTKTIKAQLTIAEAQLATADATVRLLCDKDTENGKNSLEAYENAQKEVYENAKKEAEQQLNAMKSQAELKKFDRIDNNTSSNQNRMR